MSPNPAPVITDIKAKYLTCSNITISAKRTVRNTYLRFPTIFNCGQDYSPIFTEISEREYEMRGSQSGTKFSSVNIDREAEKYILYLKCHPNYQQL